MKCRNCQQIFPIASPGQTGSSSELPPQRPAPKPLVKGPPPRPTSWQSFDPPAGDHRPAAVIIATAKPDDPKGRRLVRAVLLFPVYLLIANIIIALACFFLLSDQETLKISLYNLLGLLAAIILYLIMFIRAWHDCARHKRNRRNYVSPWWLLLHYLVYLYKRANLENDSGPRQLITGFILAVICAVAFAFLRRLLITLDPAAILALIGF